MDGLSNVAIAFAARLRHSFAARPRRSTFEVPTEVMPFEPGFEVTQH
jgi:hypothetical protein